MLGQDLLEHIALRGHEVVGLDLPEIDITDPTSVAKIMAGEWGKFDWCINCAAYTAVDKAESEEKLATEINGLAVAYLGRLTADANIRLIHISTDFVFDGTATEPISEDAPTHPIGAYGRSKLVGEQALGGQPHALIVRTAWLYGARGKSFPRTMIQAFRDRKKLKVVNDQRGNPTYTVDLCRVLVDLAEKNPFPGIYHAVGPETMTWYDFAKLAIEVSTGTEPEITPCSSAEFPTPAKRPAYSALSNEKTSRMGIAPMRPVREALTEFWEKLSF